MYYLELIERFWKFNHENELGATAIATYLFLLRIGFEKGRYDFKISDVAISKDLGITRKTVKSTKEKLMNFGLIQFQNKVGFPCSYRLVLNYPFTKIEKKELETILIESTQKIESKKQKEFVEIGDNKSKPLAEIPHLEDIKSMTKNENTPSLDEFVDYAKTLDFYNQSLDFEIQTKYENWKNNGWKNQSGKPISNWKSSLKSILPYLKNSNKDNTNYSIPKISRPKVNIQQ